MLEDGDLSRDEQLRVIRLVMASINSRPDVSILAPEVGNVRPSAGIHRRSMVHAAMAKKQPRLTKRERKALEPASAARTVHGTAGTYRTSTNLSAEALALADDYFARKDRSAGPAQQMMDFVEPLMDRARADGDLEAMNKVMSFGTIFWNLALLHGEQRVEALKKAEETISTDHDAREAFLSMAEQMIARHEQMFPWLHEPRP